MTRDKRSLGQYITEVLLSLGPILCHCVSLRDFRTLLHVTTEPSSVHPSQATGPCRRNLLPVEPSDSSQPFHVTTEPSSNQPIRVYRNATAHCLVRTISRFRTSLHVATVPSSSEPIRNFRSITTGPASGTGRAALVRSPGQSFFGLQSRLIIIYKSVS